MSNGPDGLPLNRVLVQGATDEFVDGYLNLVHTAYKLIVLAFAVGVPLVIALFWLDSNVLAHTVCDVYPVGTAVDSTGVPEVGDYATYKWDAGLHYSTVATKNCYTKSYLH